MAAISLWFPLGGFCHCVVEKPNATWQLRVLERGRTVVTHPVGDDLVARLLSARRVSLGDEVLATNGPAALLQGAGHPGAEDQDRLIRSVRSARR